MTLSPSTKIIAALMITLALSAVVMAAIAMNALGALVGGLAVTGVISIVLATIGVLLFGKYGEVKVKLNEEDHRHTEEMFKGGALPNNNRYRLLPAPQIEYDVPVSTDGETGTSIQSYQPDMRELVALSVQWHAQDARADKTQIAPYRVAKLNDYFRSGDGFNRWQNAIKALLVTHCAPRTQGNRPLGTFMRSGTVEQLWERMRG